MIFRQPEVTRAAIFAHDTEKREAARVYRFDRGFSGELRADLFLRSEFW